MKALVMGFGSIGMRHARILAELGCDVAVLSRRAVDHPKRFSELDKALSSHAPDYVVIANATHEHHDALERLAAAGYRGNVLVEKPLFDHVRPVPSNSFQRVSVAYNLRFHPLIRRVQELLDQRRIISAQAYAGQYLPEWRPSTNYRMSYSADEQRGGGVLRDLSHELDYITWMMGGWTGVSARGGHFSSLEISSDDVFALLMSTQRCPIVSVQMNYLDRKGRREVVVNCDDTTIAVDLVRSEIQVGRHVETIEVPRDASYRLMHQALLAGDFGTACSLPDAIDTMSLIEAATVSAQQNLWVTR
jgi:predicted dehydrogenase